MHAPRAAVRAALACLAALAAFLLAVPSDAAAGAPIARAPVEISPTVSLFFLEDVLPLREDPESSICMDQVKRASAFNARRLNFVITW
jgi:hypothetical protein